MVPLIRTLVAEASLALVLVPFVVFLCGQSQGEAVEDKDSRKDVERITTSRRLRRWKRNCS